VQRHKHFVFIRITVVSIILYFDKTVVDDCIEAG